MARYALEFILHLPDAQLEEIKNAIREFGEGLEITDCQDNLGKGGDFKIHIYTQDPTIIFDTCAQFGKLKSVKISDQVSP